MKDKDVELIHRILAGDDTAFATLVEKYQKQVHALAWRKIGDFHVAEELTQDTFLKVYQKLETLKNPNQFSGWLYVIATRRCLSWLRKRRLETESIEDTDIEWVEEAAYSQHVAEEHTKVTVDEQREVVKKLLSKLPCFCPISVGNHTVSDETQTHTPIEKITPQKVAKNFYTPLREKGNQNRDL